MAAVRAPTKKNDPPALRTCERRRPVDQWVERRRLEVDQILHYAVDFRAPPAAVLANQYQRRELVRRDEFGVFEMLVVHALFDGGHAIVVICRRPGSA